MTEHHAFASLSPRLLARKGGARPAMRRPEPARLAAGVLGESLEDLGWNDWGSGQCPSPEAAALAPAERAMPEVLRQIEQLAWRINRAVAVEPVARPEGRRAAFTLRLDAERHFRLRMAAVVLDRSAQVLVTEALDRYLSEIPEVARVSAADESPLLRKTAKRSRKD